MSIIVKSYSSQQIQQELEEQYYEFMQYYTTTTLTMTEILKKMDINRWNNTAKYIRKRLRLEGHDPSQRIRLIKKGVWEINDG